MKYWWLYLIILVVVVFFVDFRHLEFTEHIGAAGFHERAHRRSQAGPLDGFLDDQRPEIDGPHILDRPVEVGHRSPRSAHYYDVAHLFLSFLTHYSCLIAQFLDELGFPRQLVG